MLSPQYEIKFAHICVANISYCVSNIHSEAISFAVRQISLKKPCHTTRFFLARPTGIEPVSQEPESCVLSVILRAVLYIYFLGDM